MPIQFCANLELETIVSLLLSRLLAASDIARWLQSQGGVDTQRVTDAYTENCVVHIKIAILAMVIFAIAGRKTLYSSNATGYELQICSEDVDKSINVKSSVISKIFLTTYTTFSTYFLENDCIGICVALSFWSL